MRAARVPTPSAALTLGLLLAASTLLYCGWRLHWFLTDDAFIAFRFVGQRQLGFGYSWNAPPFRPVEGYTSFLWVLLLDAAWSLLGIEPPAIANDLALVAAFGSLALAAWAALRLHALARAPDREHWIVAAVLLAIVSQRTFLIWASSGLETALFNLCLQGWIVHGLLAGTVHAPGADASAWRRWLTGSSALAAISALARPDGLVCVTATGAIAAALVIARRLSPVQSAAGCAPLALVGAHLAFRIATYGEWLPNTYYAKVVKAWPEAGLRHFASFTLEYAYYLALPLWGIALAAWLRRALQQRTAAVAVQAIVSLAAASKLGFDVLIAGGDHFEYRSLSYLVPLAALGFVQGCLALRIRPRWAAAALVGFAAISAVLPWTSYRQTEGRFEWPARPAEPIAASVPWPLSLPAAGFDALQAWLLPHGVGIRHHEHRAFWLRQLRRYPPRAEGTRACDASSNPVHATATIGIAGWALATCHILDLFGLADHVIARTPVTSRQPRYLGHERRPPPGYVERFLPNVFVHEGGRVAVYERPRPLSDDDIRAIEREYW